MTHSLRFAAIAACYAALLTISSGCSMGADAAIVGPDPFIGDYNGVYVATGRGELPATARVVTEAPDLYRLTLQFPLSETSAPWQLELHGQAQATRVLFNGYSNGILWNGRIALEDDGSILTLNRNAQNYGGAFRLVRDEGDAPGAGTPPPEGAVVLLPYAPGERPSLDAWRNDQWIPQPDGSMQVKPGTGPNFTKERFGDCRLHLEFYLPHEPQNLGQGRANSGVYFMNRYEVQVLDSFGLVPGSGDCGGIYGVAAPMQNASLPPERWQTYDVEFRAPRLNDDGTIREHVRITVRHNGVLIHENQEVQGATVGGVTDSVVAEDVLQLQDHGNPVRYRNIWLEPLNLD